MYRRYPKKQDHGTRGIKWSGHTLNWGNAKKGMRLSYRWRYRQAKHKIKVELNKLDINCSDEDIERFEKEIEFYPQSVWYEFD